MKLALIKILLLLLKYVNFIWRYEKLEVLPGALENDNRFSGFTDLVDTITLCKGRGSDAKTAGQFKVMRLCNNCLIEIKKKLQYNF